MIKPHFVEKGLLRRMLNRSFTLVFDDRTISCEMVAAEDV